jgi:hypothetical protein
VELRWDRCESLGIFPELTALRGHASVLAGSNPSAASAWPWGTHLLHPGHFRRMPKPEIVDKQGAEGRNRTGDTRFFSFARTLSGRLHPSHPYSDAPVDDP